MGSRADGTNPRSQGTNPRAAGGTGVAASSPPGTAEARQEVSPQIQLVTTDIWKAYGPLPENIPVRSEDGKNVLITKGQYDAWARHFR